MSRNPKITFLGAGSTVFMKNIVGDVLHRPALADATITLMDIDSSRLSESVTVARKLILSLGSGATVEACTDQKAALDGADFVVVAFQIGGHEPATVVDFEVPKRFGLRQTIADTLGIGGIMRALRTVPHLWSVCEDMHAVCPNATMLQYVNPMAINTWAIAEKYPDIKQVGLCHSVQGTVKELAHDLDLPVSRIRYRVAGINHMAFFLRLEEELKDGGFRNLYPDLRRGYLEGRLPKAPIMHEGCPNRVRYEMMTRLGYFVTESSEHFAEYTPYFIKSHRPDLIDRFQIPLDEYPKRCVEQAASWKEQIAAFEATETIDIAPSHEYASDVINSIWTGTPSVIYGNVRNAGAISSLPDACAVEIQCLVDQNGIQPVRTGALPPQLTALMRTNINVQELTVAALMAENPEHVYHAAMLDPHTAAELDLDQIWQLTSALIEAHGEWLPGWLRGATGHRLAG